jgi:hypothetical protein
MGKLLLALIVLVIIILLCCCWKKAESFSEVFYLDQVAMKNSDPMYFKYSSWERNRDGLSARDYYLENELNYLNGFAPGYFEGDQLYVDHTGYLAMPPQYRPPVGEQRVTPISAASAVIDGNSSMLMSTGVQAEDTALNAESVEGFY